jgi:hypothetical protein
MARYKTIDANPRFLSVDLSQQLLTGTFEHALNLFDRARRGIRCEGARPCGHGLAQGNAQGKI